MGTVDTEPRTLADQGMYSSVLQLQVNYLPENLAAQVTMTLETAMSSSMTLTVRSGLGPHLLQTAAVPLLGL